MNRADRWRPVRLVAAREVDQRLRSRAFVIATVILLAASVAGVALSTIVQRSDTATTVSFGVLADAPGGLVGALRDAGRQASTSVSVRTYDDAAAADAAVRAGRVDAAIEGTTFVAHREVDELVRSIAAAALTSATLDQRAAAAGVTASQLDSLLAPQKLATRVLEPQGRDRSVRIGTASFGVILLFLSFQLHGNAVLSGVVEEKASRVVEVLLNHLRPWQLLAGKIIGIGAVGLVQVVAAAAGALVTRAVMQGVDVPQIPVDAVVWFVVWFVLGFALIATLFAAAGSLVSRQEDAQSASAPISIPLVVGYILSLSLVSVPDSTAARVLSIVPPTSVFVMPVRIAAGDPSVLDIAASLGIVVGSLALLLRLAGRIYARNILRTGSRVPWRQALGSVRGARS